jgi:nucleotide-binding universal stress UspA family protein
VSRLATNAEEILMNDIVVGVDQTDTARAAAQRAAELAAALNVNLHVVMCVERRKTVEMNVGGDQFHTDWIADAELALGDIVRQLKSEQTTTSVGVGDPAKSLCDEAERLDAQIIVVGNRRVQGVSRVLGSVAGDVTKNAPCDVLVVNTRDES